MGICLRAGFGKVMIMADETEEQKSVSEDEARLLTPCGGRL